MGTKKKFTPEELKHLQANPYTLRVTADSISYFPSTHTTIRKGRFGQFRRTFSKNVAPIRNFSLNTSPDALCFFGYSYIMYRVEYYPCGGAV